MCYVTVPDLKSNSQYGPRLNGKHQDVDVVDFRGRTRRDDCCFGKGEQLEVQPEFGNANRSVANVEVSQATHLKERDSTISHLPNEIEAVKDVAGSK